MVGTEKSGKSAIESGLHDPRKISAIIVEKYFKGINFPAGKYDLIQQAKDNEAPNTVILLLNEIADEEYKSVAEIAIAKDK